MKVIFYVLIATILLTSCGQQASSKSDKSAKENESKLDLIKNDTSRQAVLRITPPKKDTVVPIQEMQTEEMRAAQTTYNAGVDYYQMGDLENALNQFKSSLEYIPNNPKASHYIARIYFEKGEKTLALSYYEDAVRFDPKDSVSILAIGQIYFDGRDYNKAMDYYDKAIAAGPRYGLAYYNRGTLLGMQQKFIPALDDLNKSIKLDPKNPNAYLNRELAYYFLENLDTACKD